MTFADLAQSTTDGTFDTFGVSASYEALTNTNPETFADPVTITVLPTTRDAIVGGFGSSNVVTEERLFEVRVSEVAELSVGERLTIGGIRYKISSAPRRADKRGLKWTFGCKKDRSA